MSTDLQAIIDAQAKEIEQLKYELAKEQKRRVPREENPFHTRLKDIISKTPMTIGELAKEMGEDSRTISAWLHQIKKKGVQIAINAAGKRYIV